MDDYIDMSEMASLVKESYAGTSDMAMLLKQSKVPYSVFPGPISPLAHSSIMAFGQLLLTLLLMNSEMDMLLEVNCHASVMVCNGYVTLYEEGRSIQDYVGLWRKLGWTVEPKMT